MIKLARGHSESNRITYYTKKSEATAIRKESGEIEVTINEIKDKDYTKKQYFFAGVILFALALFEFLLIIPLIDKLHLLNFCYIFPIIFYSILLIIAITNIHISPGSNNLKKNHGAEHRVFKAYSKLKRIPLVSEAKKFSRFSGLCGIRHFSSLIINHLIAYLIYTKFAITIPQISILCIAVDFSWLFPLNSIGLLAQFFTTKKPDDDNIELAIAALSALEDYELKKSEETIKPVKSEIESSCYEDKE